MANLDAFLAPLDGENPSGAELRNDPQFHAIERLLLPASRDNRTEEPGTPPAITAAVDWSEVLDMAETLAATGRDLRLLVIVARAQANVDGIDPASGYRGYAGLAQGLEMLSATLDTFWDSLHPALKDRPSPRDAALARINALMQLENDDNGLLGDLEMNAVITPRGLGPVSGADLAAGTLTDNDILREGPSGLGAKEEAALIDAHEARVHRVEAATRAFAAEAPEAFSAVSGDLAAARAALTGLAETMNARLEARPGEGVRFAELTQFLERVAATLSAAAAHAGADAADAAAPDTAPAAGASPAPRPAPAAARGVPNGAINSREEVEHCLDMIIAFYERTEPASPIPHLARRMRRMVPMDFMELIEELAPGGVKEFRNVAGVSDEKRK
ncbi:type VI secretion system protein ImpA [Rhodovulum iodosum]|uniref:Type VI secretion system protein ImpA n=1 Tax=Rhodovulum iodosum TaxID=68291 RepID=A0ABV3XVK7_9RHOB|nr:type VI secretion system ImpA family N-terminal domain-containing protein [Rhodovulum robiginosum]RSK41023.1 hypothetical protein EJA01_00215 [Rhodovulum robiginosum]